MAGTSFTPGRTLFNRLFLIEGRARPDHVPGFEGCAAGGSLEQAFGDVEPIRCPSPDEYGKTIEIGQIQGVKERGSITLTSRFPADEESVFARLAKRQCSNDVQVHFGACTDPRKFNIFTKSIIFEDARFTNFATEDLGSLDENVVVNQSVDVSFRDYYEILQLSFAPVCDDVVTNPVVDVVICDTASCGDCEGESDGCQTIFAITNASPGSPGTAPDLIWTTNQFGANGCNADDINSMLASEDPTGVACVGTDVVVVSNDSNSLHYKAKSTITAGTALGWTEVATGFVATAEPNDIWSVGTFAFVVGDNGYVYGMDDPAAGVTVLDAGVAAGAVNLNAVKALDENFAVAVGNTDTVIFTRNQETWQATTTSPSSGGNLLCVDVKNEDQWRVGTSTGQVFYTLDAGESWTEETLPGTGYSNIWDISRSSDSVVYMAAETSTPRGRILRTYSDAGGQGATGGWIILPEGTSTIPVADAYYAVAACDGDNDPNFVVGVGLADDAADGIIVVGRD